MITFLSYNTIKPIKIQSAQYLCLNFVGLNSTHFEAWSAHMSSCQRQMLGRNDIPVSPQQGTPSCGSSIASVSNTEYKAPCGFTTHENWQACWEMLGSQPCDRIQDFWHSRQMTQPLDQQAASNGCRDILYFHMFNLQRTHPLQMTKWKTRTKTMFIVVIFWNGLKWFLELLFYHKSLYDETKMIVKSSVMDLMVTFAWGFS